MKISGVYRITNTITGDFYIGSSKNVKQRFAEHKCHSAWNKQPNSQLYKDMQKYGVGNFVFEILAEVEADFLKEKEQQFIETLKPTYNNRRANGFDIERYKDYQNEYQKEYQKSDKFKDYKKQYENQLCSYNGETITLNALTKRFWRQGIDHPAIEAKKYLIKN